MLGSDMSVGGKGGVYSPGFRSAPAPKMANMTMAPQGGTYSPGFPSQGPKSPYSGQSTIKKPQYIDINTTEDAVNNVMAQGYQQADQRYQTKQLDRAGLSRGKGQQFISGQEGAQAMSKAAEGAAQIRTEDQLANSKMRSDYEKARELEAQNLAMVQHARSQADWSRNFGHMSAAAQLRMAMQQSQLQLMMALMG